MKFPAVALVLFGLASQAWARDLRVMHLGQNMRGAYAVVNGGEAEGILIGTELCFLADDGSEAACQTVVRVKNHACAVQLTQEQRARIKAGTSVYKRGERPTSTTNAPADPSTDEGAGPAASTDDTEIESKVDAADLKGEVEKLPAAKVVEPAWRPRRISADFVYFGVAPLTYSLASYDADARLGGGNVWTQADELKSSPVGLALQYEWPLKGRWTVGLQVGYGFMPKLSKASDYDVTDPTQSVTSSIVGHLYRFGADAGYGVWRKGSVQLAVRGGADLIAAKATFEATRKSDTTGGTSEVAKLELSTITFTPKASLDLVWTRSALALDAGIVLAKALSPRTTVSGSVSDVPTGSTASAEKERLENILGPEASPLAWGIVVGAGYALQ